jgi:protein-disulfide isomerase
MSDRPAVAGDPLDTDSGQHALPASPRRRRLLQLGLMGTLVAGAMALLVATSGSGKPPIVVHGPKGAIATVEAMLGGIPQQANRLGSPTAPITLEYFGDLECPFCREFTVDALPSIIARWVKTGTLQIIYRSMQTATKNSHIFETQQVAALAAALQNRMWYYLELFYHEQGEEDSGYVTEQYLQGLAQQVPGLNLPQWMSDRNNATLTSDVLADNHAAHKIGLAGTPGLFFGRTGGRLTLYRPPSLSKPAGFDKVIEKLLA